VSKYLYIKKKTSNASWSDVLDRQYRELAELSGGNFELFEIDTSSIQSFWRSIVLVTKLLKSNRHQVVYINHIICAYPSLLGILFFKGKKILALHEGEPVLGLSFAFKNRQHLSVKEFLRYSPFFNLPPLFFSSIFILNEQQNVRRRPHFYQVNFLGVNQRLFYPNDHEQNDKGLLRLFFPNNPVRPEKGFDYIKQAVELLPMPYTLYTGGKYKHQEMNSLYNSADVVFLSSMYETYSMALLEAMAVNKTIIAHYNVGLVQNMLTHKSKEELKDYGIWVVDVRDINGLRETLITIYNLKSAPKTLQLLEELELAEPNVNRKLYHRISAL
jgi:glycosyltransferase involved in cell wall biosynthesis